MNLRSGAPYWLLHNPLLYSYSAITENINTDVVVIGIGISGALAVYELVKAAYQGCIISHLHVGTTAIGLLLLKANSW